MRQGQIVTVGLARPGRTVSSARPDRSAGERLIIEDGWVFREHHGKYVECICRSDDLTLFNQDLRQKAGC